MKPKNTWDKTESPVWGTLSSNFSAEISHIIRVFCWSLVPILFTLLWFPFVFYFQKHMLYVFFSLEAYF